MEIQGHPGVDQTTRDYLPTPACGQGEGRDNGDPLSRFDKSNLRVHKIDNHNGLRERAGLQEVLVDELLPTSSRWYCNQPLSFQGSPPGQCSPRRYFVIRPYDYRVKREKRCAPYSRRVLGPA